MKNVWRCPLSPVKSWRVFSVYFLCIFRYISCISMIFGFQNTLDSLPLLLMITCHFTLIATTSPQILTHTHTPFNFRPFLLQNTFLLTLIFLPPPLLPGAKINGRRIFFLFLHFCPGTMTAHAESINSDLQRGLDRRLRHTTLNTEQNQLAIRVSADN